MRGMSGLGKLENAKRMVAPETSITKKLNENKQNVWWELPSTLLPKAKPGRIGIC